MFHFIEKVNEGHVKMINVNYKNGQISRLKMLKMLKSILKMFIMQAGVNTEI